jgi:nitrite reductase (NO-forming)
MAMYRIPGSPALGSTELGNKFAAASATDRRSLLKRAAGLGLAVPGLAGMTAVAGAQDEDGDSEDEGTPEPGYVGSDPGAHGTGSDAPAAGEVQPFTLYDPFLPAVEAGTKEIEVVARDATVYIVDEVPFAGWTFDGAIPGRTLRAVEGDTIDFTFKVAPEASTAHSLDFHSAKTPPDKSYATISPGEELCWSFEATYPGAYMYHCGTPPVLMHIGAGMYGGMIVDPKEGWSPAQELVLVQGDFYLLPNEDGTMVPDYTKMLGTGAMDYLTFNGYANQYVANPIKVAVGEAIRIFVVNAGPNAWSSFHVVGAIFDRTYPNANPKNALVGMQSITIGPGDGACVELTLEEPGTYPAVNHAFGHAAHGAIALLQAE